MKKTVKQPLLRLSVALVASLGLAACASPDEEGALRSVNSLVVERAGETVVWHRDDASREQAAFAVRNLLSEPLSAEGAVQFAFLRNPAIQASLANLGISEADVAQAGRLRNPVFSIERVAGGGAVEVSRQILFSLMSLLTLEARTEIARSDAEGVRYEAALEIVQAANEVRTAWVEAVGARERSRLVDRIFNSASAAEELAQRMVVAGNMSALEQAQIKANLAEVAGQRGELRAAAEMARERLIRAMGVWGDDLGFELPNDLPSLPGAVRDFGAIERIAISQRLDIRVARTRVQTLARNLDLTKASAVISLVEVGLSIDSEREPEEDDIFRRDLVGFEFEFEIPIFDQGEARISRATWEYMQAVEQLRSLAVTARSEVREAYVAYRASLDLARHYRDVLVPLRAQISQEELVRYNGMLASVFDLLSATEQHSAASIAALDARQDFWMANDTMDAVLLTGTASAPGLGGGTEMAAAGGAEEH